ncbi:MAG: hypothetical protein AAGF04_01630 [Chlamydiota bacterium]
MYLLPALQSHFAEENFAEVRASWDEAGFFFHFFVTGEPTVGKDRRKSDSIELFFNTKGDDPRTFFTQFCHHFVLTPEAVHGAFFQEVTKFRTEETHPLFEEKEGMVDVKISPGKYWMACHIPFTALHGYQREEKSSLTFFYRINRKGASPQSLSCSHAEYDPEKTPLLWSRILCLP